MNKGHFTFIHLGMLIIPLVTLLVSCSENATGHDALQVEFSHTPTYAVVNTPITLLFAVEAEGEHLGVDNPACEIHTLGDVTLTEGEVGTTAGCIPLPRRAPMECIFHIPLKA